MFASFAPDGWLGFEFVNTHGKQIPDTMGFQGPNTKS